jgi:Flp pilus assembly protein TadG
MILRHNQAKRRGAILVLLTLALVVICGFTALAIDIGIVAVARSQCQNAADSGAMAGARTFNGSTTNNFANAGPNALLAATSNFVLGQAVTDSMVTIRLGSYSYNTSLQKFVVTIPKATSDNWTLAEVTVARQIPTFFGRIFGIQSMSPRATSIAVHRPRDVSIILDFSGSMRFDSLLGVPYNGARTMSNNPETVFPQFGHYSDTTAAALRNSATWTTIGDNTYGASNVTVETPAGPPVVTNFYSHATGGTVQSAFTAAPSTYETTPGGDNFLKTNLNTGANYAKTVNEILNTTSRHAQFETSGYQHVTGLPYQGYTQGPSYWGKTFFMWPPDPLAANDWRRKFFFKNDGVTPVDDNTLLWDASGNWRVPRSSSTNNNYRINYNAILAWLKTTGNNPFPTRLRSGRVLYYDAIPDTIDVSTFPPADNNQRFWKDYIDYVLGLQQNSGTGSTVNYSNITVYTGYGDDYTWGTVQITAKPTTGTPPAYMNYNDNPKRGRLHFWFGPMTMMDFLGNYNIQAAGNSANPAWLKHWWWPGTCYEAPTWSLKTGIQSSLKDIEFNHPNDWVTMTYFSVPVYDSGNSNMNRFNRIREPLGRNYSRMIERLWYSPYSVDNPTTEMRPYDYTNFLEMPHAMGGTCPVMGFMQTFNQYSNHSSLLNFAPAPAPAGQAGGLGRRGAQKLIILETDGMANTPASASFSNNGANNSYYEIRYPGETPSDSGTVTTQCYNVVDQIVALESSAGYSTIRKPVIIHCIGFGTIFEPGVTSSQTTPALTFLQTIQFKGKTQANTTDPLPTFKRITGTAQQRIDKLQQAFSAIMQDGVQVTLIQ